ncbi:MAG: YHS domain-containing protein [Candidatus Limnocylindrales bacterium]
MQTVRPEKLIDPVCGMAVDVHGAEHSGLLLEYEGRTYAFCRTGCLRAFVEEPAPYVAQAEAAQPEAAQVAVSAERPTTTAGLLVIDEGMRRWYESCSCCLSEAYPEIKAQLDAERVAHAHPPAEPGICEVAEAMTGP